MRFLILLLILFHAFITSGSEVYTWKDKNGVTHFSDHPPPQVDNQKKYKIIEKGITRFADHPPQGYKEKQNKIFKKGKFNRQAEPDHITKSQSIEKFQSKKNTKEKNIKPNLEDRRNSFNQNNSSLDNKEKKKWFEQRWFRYVQLAIFIGLIGLLSAIFQIFRDSYRERKKKIISGEKSGLLKKSALKNVTKKRVRMLWIDLHKLINIKQNVDIKEAIKLWLEYSSFPLKFDKSLNWEELFYQIIWITVCGELSYDTTIGNEEDIDLVYKVTFEFIKEQTS